ncbi:hypothetical protein BXU06_16580 [Aquaspirillum sp. LM1]|uniref:hypothetical protein n=1 Tax=Aquaspirillum sp. LM1 TaxID=1938604 RepID=UPI000983D876|nr:hypothetical protein [Aquaspirillum sp. LM1]AQR66486.1 hypothetical protein BXU06_16580 [Aquaspirillum sp. LM1]
MTTSSLPSAARSQPVTLDVDIELTELTPPAGLPAHSPVNPPEVDLLALQQREEDAFARIFRRKGAKPRPTAPPPVTETPVTAAPAPAAPDTPPILSAAPTPAEQQWDNAAPEPAVDAFAPALAEPPALLETAAIPQAAADTSLPEVALENADLDAFVHALLASAERDRAMPVDTVPMLEPMADDLPLDAGIENSLPAVDGDEPLDFAFDDLLIAELDNNASAPASLPPTLAQPLDTDDADNRQQESAQPALAPMLDASDAPVLTALPDAPALTAVADDDELAQAFNDMLAAAAEPPTPDSAPADAEAALAFDLDELLMLDPPVALADEAPAATPVALAESEPTADHATPMQRLLEDVLALPPLLEDAPASEPASPTVPQAFDLDDMLMLDQPAAASEQADAADRAEEQEPAPEAWLSAESAPELPVLDAPLVDATPNDHDHADHPAAEMQAALEFDLDEMLMLAEPAVAPTETPAQASQPAPATSVPPLADDSALALDDLLPSLTAELPMRDAPVIDTLASPADAPATLAFDLDDMLMLDASDTERQMSDALAAPASESAVTAADDHAQALTLDEWLTVDPSAANDVPAKAADDAPATLAFDLDDMLMLDPPSAEPAAPVEREVLTLDHDDILAEALQDMAAEPPPVAEALATDASAEPSQDLDDPLTETESAHDLTVTAPESLADTHAVDFDDALMAELALDAADQTDDALDFAFSTSAAALADVPSALDEHDAAAAGHAQADDDLLDPLPVLDALEEPSLHDNATEQPAQAAQAQADTGEEPVAAPAAALLDLDLDLAAPPLLDALHDEPQTPTTIEPAASTENAPPAQTSPTQALPAASLSVAEPAELPLPLLEEEHRAPMAAASPPASHDSDILAMLAQSLEGNWWSMVQGSPAHYSMFRRGLGRLAQRLADLPATGLPALVEALIAQADSLPISGPSAWAAEAVSQALETLGDALLSLPTPSTTQRAAVQARTRELLAGPPPAPISMEEAAPVDTTQADQHADAPPLMLTEEAEAEDTNTVVQADTVPELSELEQDTAPQAEPDDTETLEAPEIADPDATDVALTLELPTLAADADDLPGEPASLDQPQAELMLELGVEAEVAPLDIPALSLSDVLEDAPVWPEEDLPPVEDTPPATEQVSTRDESPVPEALALADGSVPLDPALLDTAEAPVETDVPAPLATDADAEAEEDSPLPAVLDASDDAAALAELDSVQVIDPPSPAVAQTVTEDDDDWTQPPLAELSRLAKEAPLASPTPATDLEAEPEAAAEVLTHWPADEETAALPGFAELPELGCAPEQEPAPEPATQAADDDGADEATDSQADVLSVPLETVAEALAAEAAASEAAASEATSEVAADAIPASERTPLRSITLEDIPHLRQMLGGNSSSGSFPTVAEALAEPEMPDTAPAAPAESPAAAPAPTFSNSIAVSDIPLLRAGTLEALLEKIEPVEEVPAETPAPPTPDVVPLGPTQLAAFFASMEADAPAAPIPAIDLAAFLVVAQGLVQRMVQECRNARSQGIGPGFVSAADELGRNARDAGVPDMANLAAALASALTRPLSPQAVLELATDTVAVLSMMVTQGQRHEPIEGAPDMVAALEALIAKPPVRKLP